MPTKPPSIRPCCNRVIAAGDRCECQRERDRDRGARHDRNRPTAAARGYGARWREFARRFLRQHGACAFCGANATVVDHIVPHRGDTSIFWRAGNHQPLCAACHNSRKQRAERRAVGE